MFKCGQKDNKNYTFGVTDKQIKEARKKEMKICSSCGSSISSKSKFCSSCGEKV